VSALLVNSQGEVLLQLRDDRPDLLAPGFWTLPGGAIEPGETPTQAIHRELREEMELSLPLRYWKAYHARRGPGGSIVVRQHIFTGQLDLPASAIPLHEGQAVRFFGPDGIRGLQIAFGFDKLLGDFYNRGSNHSP
jgi:8-oxo-dGTP pyrophosphatase MutT (NUDIX family)